MDQWALAERTGQAQPLNGAVPVEVHWPCVDKRALTNWRREIEPPSVSEDGAVYLQEPGAYQARALAALAVLFRGGRVEAPFHLRFSDVRTMDQQAALYQLLPVLERYRLGAGWEEWLLERPGRQFDVSILLRLRADAAQAWVEVPGPKQALFHDRLIVVANAIQVAIRVWLTYAYFQDLAQYAQPASAWPIIVFAAMKPYRGKSRVDYCHEVTDRATIQKALWGVLPVLEDEMRRIAPRLDGLVLRDQFMYSQRRTTEMVRMAERFPRQFGSLLFGEREIIEGILRFAQNLHEAMQTAKPDNVIKLGSALHRKVERRLASIYGTFDFGSLGAMIVLEATSALAQASGKAFPIEAMVRIRDRQEGADYYSANSSFTG